MAVDFEEKGTRFAKLSVVEGLLFDPAKNELDPDPCADRGLALPDGTGDGAGRRDW